MRICPQELLFSNIRTDSRLCCNQEEEEWKQMLVDAPVPRVAARCEWSSTPAACWWCCDVWLLLPCRLRCHHMSPEAIWTKGVCRHEHGFFHRYYGLWRSVAIFHGEGWSMMINSGAPYGTIFSDKPPCTLGQGCGRLSLKRPESWWCLLFLMLSNDLPSTSSSPLSFTIVLLIIIFFFIILIFFIFIIDLVF